MSKIKIETGEMPEHLKESKDEPIPYTDDMESGETVCEMTKEDLKQTMKEIQQEERLKWTVECKSADECKCIIKLANERIAELKRNPTSNSNGKSSVTEKY